MTWLDDLTPGERDALYDAGRIGKARFEGPDDPPIYARHIGNPKMALLIKDIVGKNMYGDPCAVLLLPGSKPRRWFAAEIIKYKGSQVAAAVDELLDEDTAHMNAERRVQVND